MRFGTHLVPCLALLLSGCVTEQTTVIQQSQQAAVTAPVPASPSPHSIPVQCAPPRGFGPFTPAPPLLNPMHYPKPAKALAAHISGCASARFHVGPDGIPTDIQVMAEYPPGFGIADSLTQAISEARFAPNNDPAWHLRGVTFRWRP